MNYYLKEGYNDSAISASVNITVFMIYKTKISILFITKIAQYSCLYEIKLEC